MKAKVKASFALIAHKGYLERKSNCGSSVTVAAMAKPRRPLIITLLANLGRGVTPGVTKARSHTTGRPIRSPNLAWFRTFRAQPERSQSVSLSLSAGWARERNLNDNLFFCACDKATFVWKERHRQARSHPVLVRSSHLCRVHLLFLAARARGTQFSAAISAACGANCEEMAL